MSRLRPVKEFSANGNTCRVYYSAEYAEYQCKLYEGKSHREGADYFTDCKQDALMTARNMLQTFNENIAI